MFGITDIRLICNLRIGLTGNSFTLWRAGRRGRFSYANAGRRNTRGISEAGHSPATIRLPSAPVIAICDALPKSVAYCNAGQTADLRRKLERGEEEEEVALPSPYPRGKSCYRIFRDEDRMASEFSRSEPRENVVSFIRHVVTVLIFSNDAIN